MKTIGDRSVAAMRRNVSRSQFTAMGSSGHILVVGGRPRLVTQAEQHIARLERAWSRFLRDSELCALNASSGRAVAASKDLYRAVRCAVDAWSLTAGAYDPTVLRAVEAAGYDRSFELVTDSDGSAPNASVPGCGDIVLDDERSTIALPDGAGLDLGGIGKGLAADLVVAELFRSGADGALVNIGGDVRVAGTAIVSDGWVVEIEDPFRPDERGVCIAIADGAVATSSTLEKTWLRAGAQMHHLIDPATGAPVQTDIATVTVVANEAWWAEALAKAVFMLGVDAGCDLIESHGVHGLIFLTSGHSVVAGDWREILA